MKCQGSHSRRWFVELNPVWAADVALILVGVSSRTQDALRVQESAADGAEVERCWQESRLGHRLVELLE